MESGDGGEPKSERTACATNNHQPQVVVDPPQSFQPPFLSPYPSGTPSFFLFPSLSLSCPVVTPACPCVSLSSTLTLCTVVNLCKFIPQNPSFYSPLLFVAFCLYLFVLVLAELFCIFLFILRLFTHAAHIFLLVTYLF